MMRASHLMVVLLAFAAHAAEAPEPGRRDPDDSTPAAAAGSGAAEKRVPSGPRSNPALKDPAQELTRLRIEGLANFEMGVTLKSALPLFEAALQLQPASAVEQFNLGTTKWKLKQAAEARPLLEKAAADPAFAQPLYVLALIEKAAGKPEAALALMEKAKERAPAEPSIHYQLAVLYKVAGREDAMIQALTNLLALDPFHTGAIYQLYQYHQRAGNTDRAQALFKEFSRLKRAATFSRREVNYEEGVLTLPVLNLPGDADAGASPFEATFTTQVVPLSSPAVAFDVRELDGDDKEDVVAIDASGRVSVARGAAAGALKVAALDGAVPQGATEEIVAEGFVAKAGPGLLSTGPKGLAYAPLGASPGPLAWRPIADVGEGASKLIFDADHDGDLDLLDKAGVAWVNDGNAGFSADKAFFAPEVRGALAAATRVLAAPFGERDGIDLLLQDAGGERRFLVDSQGGRYDLVETRPASLPGVVWSGTADLDNDGRVDVVSLGDSQLIVEPARGRFTLDPKPARYDVPAGAGAAAIADFDNDGRQDLLVFKSGHPPVLLHNRGRARFVTKALKLAAVPPLRQAPIAADVDGDGRVDVVTLGSNGELRVWMNQSAGTGQFVKLRLQGIRSVPGGAATRLETRSRDHYQWLQATGRLVHLGLGNDEYAQLLRITWPNGFVENKFKVDVGRLWTFKESERISGSCPTLFAWDGERFRFVTDAFISGPMGVPMAKGRYFPVDHDEYIKIGGDQLVRGPSGYSLRVTEELREVNYFDQVRLLAVDHPAEVTVYPNERLGPFPPSDFHVFGTASSSAPLAAVDSAGHDVRDLVESADGRYPRHLVHTQYTGLAEPHWIELTLPPEALRSPHLRLFLTGWFYYFESSSLIALSQRPDLRIGWPEIQAETGGEWRAVAVAGIPPGKHKTVVVPLGGQLPEGTRRLRVWTNLALYWDALRYDAGPPRDDSHRLTEIPLRSATVRFRGFSGLVRDPDPSIPEHFDYEQVVHSGLWNPLRGRYTRYGDVLRLLQTVDSQFVVFGAGDELALEFGAAALPEPPEGWRRDYLVYFDGYVKDGDPHTAYAMQVEPMPFAGMRAFPYDEQERRRGPFESAEYREYLESYQTRMPLSFTGPALSVTESGAGAQDEARKQ
jgi:tetratricopeptide (TPR) repeat protein